MWINIGTQQIHIPKTDKPQVVSGHIGLLTPSIDKVTHCLQDIQNHPLLSGTKFSWKIKDTFGNGLVPKEYNDKIIHVTCPWGNKFRIYQFSKIFGNLSELRILYLLHHCEKGTLVDISHIYKFYFDTPVYHVKSQNLSHVVVGPWQRLVFKEHEKYNKNNYNGYHVAIYITNFSRTYQKFLDDNLVFTKHRYIDKCDSLKDALQWQQFRTLDFVNDKKDIIFQLEHEVRSLYHPSFRRALVNRFGNVGIYCHQ